MPHTLPTQRSFFERLPLLPDRPWVGLIFAVALPFLALWARMWLGDALGSGYPFITFLPCVTLLCFFFGRWPGIVAALLGGMMARYFFVEPVNTLNLTSGSALALTFYFCIVAMVIFFIDLAQRSNADGVRAREIAHQLAQTRVLLFHELQHRVANNLQVVGALLSAQRRRVTDPAARQALEEAANRLTIIGQISRELYHADGAVTQMQPLMERLAGAVLEATGRQDVTCLITVESGLVVADDHIVPLALVMTEALSNALEHGIPSRAGQVVVRLASISEQRIELLVEDDGAGIAPHFTLDSSDNLGLRIARQLAQQLGGEFTLTPRPDGTGARARLTLARND